MNLLNSDIIKIISSYENTIVAQVVNDNNEFDSSSVIIKYQNTDYPSVELDSLWEHEYKTLQSIDSDGVIIAYGLKKNKSSYVLLLEDFSSITLANLIEQDTLSFSQRLHVANQLAIVLADVHRHDFIHRNINPENILIDPVSLKIKLFNFSNATYLSHTKVEMKNNDLQGRYEYISPEQTGRINVQVDYRSDFYSLGVVLYELFSGRLPFSSTNMMTLLHCHIARTPDLITTVNQEVPEAISLIIAKLMKKSLKCRYQSAFALKTDLNSCYQSWLKNEKIEEFTLTESDVPLHFQVSSKLYGREEELDTLLQGYQRSCIKRTELAMVSGYSGVGKSALVNKLQKSIATNNGILVSGKCEQYNRGQPFSVLIDALQQLLQKILSGNKESQFNWRNKLHLVLGNNASIITEILPALTLIIGEPSSLTTLPPAESELRLNMVFTDFVSALYSSEQPLVIFLDDLQWVDIPTLKLLQQQVGGNSQTGLYIIGAYRDNEVDDSHPLTSTLKVMEQLGNVSKIHLQPLKPKYVQELLNDTLHCSNDDTIALTELCINKTQGNPFFLNQFLLALYQEKDISYNHKQGRWQWDFEQIAQRDMTDNVVDLMIMRLKLLNQETQLLASVAAHLGHQFSFKQISTACQYSVEPTKNILRPLLDAGFILPLDEHCQYVDDEAHLHPAHYRFLHDRVQQAAYMLTPEEGREQLLLHIGRNWLEDSVASEIELNLYTLLSLLNGAIQIIDDVDELKQLATLNYQAGLNSKSAANYNDAVNYLRIAEKLLASDTWEIDPQQTIEVHKALIDVEFLAGNIDIAKALYEKCIEKVSIPADKISLILLRAEQCLAHGDFHESVALLMYGLNTLNVQFPLDEDSVSKQLENTFIETERLRTQFSEKQLLLASKMIDSSTLLRMEIHNTLATAFYLAGRMKSYAMNACHMVGLTLNYGQCELSSIGYASYATAMSMMGKEYPTCYQISKLAKSVSDLWDSKYHRAMIYQYFASSYQHWCEPLENSYAFQEQVISWGQEGINCVYAGYAVLFKACNKFINGVQLSDLKVDIEQGIAFLNKKQQSASVNFVMVGAYQSLIALQGEADSSNFFDTDSFSVTQYFNGDFSTPSMDLAFYTAAMIRHAFLMGDKMLQQQCVSNINIVSMFLPDSPIMTDSLFYQALIILDDCHNKDNKVKHLGEAIKICDKFCVWAKDSPVNYHHKFLLLSAEISRVKNDIVDAMNYYALSISEAKQEGYINCEALSSERYAIYLQHLGQNRLAISCIKDAHYLYSRWGAHAKCMLLEQQWPEQSFTLANTALQIASESNNLNKHVSKKGIISLDLHSLLRANQLLSEEIHVNSLLEKMMSVLIENAGAQQGAIVVYGDGQLIIEIVGRINNDASRIDSQFYNTNLDDIELQKTPLLPDTLIRYTQKTMETLILDNPFEDPRFLNNAYILENQPKSVMCLPILGQGRLVAIVYLENNITEKAFTPKHRNTVELIAAQAAVSLINARHYESLEDKVAQRTQELQQLAIKDGLTGIFNRREFDIRLNKEWSRSSRESGLLSLIMIDIDHFKAYNDNYGHPEGDKCIKLVAETLSSVITRNNDLVARYGGEEFVVLMTNTDHMAVENIAERCQEKIRALNIPHAFSSTAEHITISMGVCTMTTLPGLEPSMLVKSADVALYKSKKNGRNQYYFASPV
jgi:diguanylate cyclase (GGDEF)-like protein